MRTSIPSTSATQPLHIMHFNDVYRITSQKFDSSTPAGGAPRFQTVLNHMKTKGIAPLVFASGDLIGAGLFKELEGKDMTMAASRMGLHGTVLGNHDLDYGLDIFKERVSDSSFPWYSANLLDASGAAFAGVKPWEIIEWHGKKIAVIGLINDWLKYCTKVEKGKNVLYRDYISVAKEFISWVKSQPIQPDLIVALTHMNLKHDLRLAQFVPELDLILGGHDHEFMHLTKNGTPILKSGTNWQYATHVEVNFDSQGKPVIRYKAIPISKDIIPSNDFDDIIALHKEITTKDQTPIAFTSYALDGRSQVLRTRETNMSQLIGDALKNSLNTDLAFLFGGLIRSDKIFPPGPITKTDINSMLPFDTAYVASVDLTGKQVLEFLKYGLANIGTGDFLQASGIELEFQITDNSNVKLDPRNIFINGEPFDQNKTYSVACYSVLANEIKEHFPNIKIKRIQNTQGKNIILAELVIDYLSKQKVLEYPEDKMNIRECAEEKKL